MTAPSRTLRLRAARVFTGHELLDDGVLVVEDGRVVAVGAACDLPTTGDTADTDLGDVLLAPGFVDVHCHGGGGAAFADDPDAALALHRSCGTTTSVASLVTQSLDVLAAQVLALAPLVAAGELAGIHLEGPWLAPGRKGAHPLDKLRSPAPDEVARLVDAGGGAVRMVTIAPELTGGLAAIALLAARGVVAAVGHTDADLATTRAAVDAGATGATHLFNAMPGLHHREPGPVLGLGDDARVWLELIADGVHVHPELLAATFRAAPGRVVLVTDAMAAAGCSDGDYTLGDLAVEVRGGVARLAGQDTIAGSTLTLDAAVRLVIGAGVPWREALRAATVHPARYLGLRDVGDLRPGGRADAVVLDDAWGVRGVLRGGAWVRRPA